MERLWTVIELILLGCFMSLVFIDADMRFIFFNGIMYLAMVIRHTKERE